MTTVHERIPTRISPDLLDTIGRSFKFRHAKGIAEWLKNSLDHYLRLRSVGQEPRAGSWPVLINLIDGTNNRNGPNLAVVDFGGTTFINVRDFFLHWGDRSAATLGGASDAAVTGGHGNGGKFYMREMWRGGARFYTWRDEMATSLIVEKTSDGTTGYWELKDERMDWRDGLKYALPDNEVAGGSAWIEAYLSAHDPELIRELDNKKRGMTVVLGRRAEQVLSTNDVVRGGRWDHQRLVDEIHDAPQSRRPIRELRIAVFVNGALRIPRLSSRTIDEDPEWPPIELDVPASLIKHGETAGTLAPAGRFTIRKSVSQLVVRQRDQNAVFVIDGAGNPIAFYPIRELPIPGHSSVLAFLSCELQLTFDSVESLVQNDRERLAESPTTEALLEWLGEQLLKRAQEVELAQQSVARQSALQIATVLNDALNRHAQRFLQELQTEMLVDLIQDAAGGGPGDLGEGTGQVGEGEAGNPPADRGTGGSVGEGGTTVVPGTAERARRPRFPQVLLSGIDADPSKPDGTTKHLTERHPPLDQDDVDRMYNVWWINTMHPFAQVALEHGGPKGAAFRSHQLSMFREVVQREGLRILQRRERELDLDRVENELSEISNRFLAELPHDLIRELLG